MHTNVTMRDRRFSFYTFISLLWLTGLLVGLAIAFYFSSITTPIISNSFFPDSSVWGIFVSGVVPLALTYFFIKIQWMSALQIHLFIRALLYGFCFFYVTFCFQEDAWLATGISFLSHACCTFLMIFLCLNALTNHFSFRKISLYSFCSFAVICVLEHLIALYIN